MSEATSGEEGSTYVPACRFAHAGYIARGIARKKVSGRESLRVGCGSRHSSWTRDGLVEKWNEQFSISLGDCRGGRPSGLCRDWRHVLAAGFPPTYHARYRVVGRR